MALGLLSL